MSIRLLIALLLPCVAAAQDISITAGALQTNPKLLVISVTETGKADSLEKFFGPGGPGHTASSLNIYIVTHADEPEMKASNNSADYIDPKQEVQFGFDTITVPLIKPLLATKGQYYLVVINGIGSTGRLISKVEPKGSVVSPDPTKISNQVKITAPIPLQTSVTKLEIDRKKVTEKAGQATVEPEKIAASLVKVDSDGIVLDLAKPLPTGANSVTVVGLADVAGNPVSAQGKIQVDPAPVNESDAYLLAKIGANAAVHQAPIFTFAGNIAPLHPPLRAVFWGPVRVDPSTNIDVGLRSTKSANSIIVPAPFSSTYISGLPNPGDADSSSQLRKVNPIAMQFSFGPRLETDRNFQRLNALGELRWELYLPGLSKDMTGRKARVAALHPEYRDFLELPIRGYSFAPYFQFDGGGHVDEETVTNSKTKQVVIVPSHSIARTYFGIKGNIQYWLISVDLDSYYVNMLDPESIGYTTTTQALLRHVEGWQPHTKASVSIFLSQAKHTAFNVSWESGRTAPNFEYLNKADVGFKLIY